LSSETKPVPVGMNRLVYYWAIANDCCNTSGMDVCMYNASQCVLPEIATSCSDFKIGLRVGEVTRSPADYQQAINAACLLYNITTVSGAIYMTMMTQSTHQALQSHRLKLALIALVAAAVLWFVPALILVCFQKIINLCCGNSGESK